MALVLASWSAMARRLVGDWHSGGVSIGEQRSWSQGFWAYPSVCGSESAVGSAQLAW